MSLTPEQVSEVKKQIAHARRKANEAEGRHREVQVALDRAQKILSVAEITTHAPPP